jgi:hypothetical protein
MKPQRPTLATAAIAAVAVAAATLQGNINLEFRPAVQSATLAEEAVGVGLYAASDSADDQLLSAIQAIVQWDPAHVRLIGLDTSGAVPLVGSGFPDDPFGLNEIDPPQDGDGLYVALALPPVAATPAGTLLTTFLFEPLATTPGTEVAFLEEAGSPPTQTIVYDGTVPNLDVTGTLSGAVIEILPCCPPDLDADCIVGINDLLDLLAAWGTNPIGPPDLNGDAVVGINDLLILLAAWGPCP